MSGTDNISEELKVCANGASADSKGNCPTKVIKLEFQPMIYMLDNDLPREDDIDVRYRLMEYSSKNIKDDNDSMYLYGMLPVDMIPAAYLPFRYDNPEINFSKLTYNDTLPDSYYKSAFRQAVINDTKYKTGDQFDITKFKKYLKDYFEYYLNYRLQNHRSVPNSFNSDGLIIITCIFWMIVLIFLMKTLYYHFSDVYTYLVFGMIILLLIFAVLWKMFYTLQ